MNIPVATEREAEEMDAIYRRLLIKVQEDVSREKRLPRVDSLFLHCRSEFQDQEEREKALFLAGWLVGMAKGRC